MTRASAEPDAGLAPGLPGTSRAARFGTGSLAAIALLFLGLPVAALLARGLFGGALRDAPAEALFDALYLSLITTVATVIVIVVFGSPLAWVLALAHRLAARTCRLSARIEDPSLEPCHDTTRLETAGLSSPQVEAIHRAYFDCLDHRRISSSVDSDQTATALITDGLRRLELSTSSR